jgi:2-polyprenyl-3-methyl-5-hydroxy-6-metoxy-1,4-benzoquinol methylase
MTCPLHHDCAPRLVRVLDPAAIAHRWMSEYAIEVDNSLLNLREVNHWRCELSGFEWYDPPEAAGGARLYEQLAKYPWYYMPDKWEFAASLKYLARGSNVLEVGSGSGTFLQVARSSGIQIAGVELNPSAAQHSRDMGFRVTEDDIRSLAVHESQRYDAVCAFQVLEHVTDPVSFLADMLRLVRIGGIIVLAVPNDDFMSVIDSDHRNLLNQPPHHMSHWSRTAIDSFTSVLPMKLVACRREPLQLHHISWFVNGFSGYVRNRFGGVVGGCVANRITRTMAATLCRIGFRHMIPGHTLLAVLVRMK